MDNSTRMYEGKLNNGVEFEIHSMSSFSGKSEIALFIKGQTEPFSIWSIDKKKTGTIECRPLTNIKKIILGKKSEGEDTEQKPVDLNI